MYYGNFGEKFSVKWFWYFFWHQKQECSIYKVPLNFLLSLERKPGIIHTNGADIFARFRKSGKKIMPRKVIPFFRRIFTAYVEPFR